MSFRLTVHGQRWNQHLAEAGTALTDSPFVWQGQPLRYAGVPHQQVSMLLVSPSDEVDLDDRPPARPGRSQLTDRRLNRA